MSQIDQVTQSTSHALGVNKKVILLAGYPATGKSYLCQLILKRHPKALTINQDDLKEKMWDDFGFDTIEEKRALEQSAWCAYYKAIENAMQEGALIVSDYPFSQKQRPQLESLRQAYGYDILTLRLVGDIDKLYERSRARDLDSSRHLGHLVSRYHKGDTCQERSKASCFVDEATFKERCANRGYDQFQLGQLIEVDVTDFDKVNYDLILDQIDDFLKGR